MEHCETGHVYGAWLKALIYQFTLYACVLGFCQSAEARTIGEAKLVDELVGWQPFNTMVTSDELRREAQALLKLSASAPVLEQRARERGVSAGRLGWIKVKARTIKSLTHALVREAYVAFQDGEFDRFGAALHRKKGRWEALLLAERRAVSVKGLPRKVELGREVSASEARWALEHEEEGLLSWHVQLPSGQTREGRCLSNGLCRLPILKPMQNGWMVVQLMVDRGLGPEVGFSKHLLVGKAPETTSSRRGQKGPRLLGRRLLETLLNNVRKEAALPPLEFDGLLHEIATKKVEVIASRRSFGHRIRGERSAGSQLVDADVAFSRVVETIADGSNVEALVRQWLASPAHRAKILDPTLKRAGLGLKKPSKTHRSFTGVLLLTDELG